MRTAPTIRTTTALALAATFAIGALTLAACSSPTTTAATPPQQQQAPAAPQLPVAQAPAGTPTKAAGADPAKARQLIAQKCGVGCHSAGAVLNNATKDPQVWESVFTDMQRRGASVTAQEKQVMVDYLVTR